MWDVQDLNATKAVVQTALVDWNSSSRVWESFVMLIHLCRQKIKHYRWLLAADSEDVQDFDFYNFCGCSSSYQEATTDRFTSHVLNSVVKFINHKKMEKSGTFQMVDCNHNSIRHVWTFTAADNQPINHIQFVSVFLPFSESLKVFSFQPSLLQ